MDITYDLETFSNCFLMVMRSTDRDQIWYYEISDRVNNHAALKRTMEQLARGNHRMIGFNNTGFDYPVLHYILSKDRITAAEIYDRAMQVITHPNRFANMIRPSDCWVPQVDLMRLHHFDNKARMTSLKTLEFNMRLSNISDLPFPVGTTLTSQQMDVLGSYCMDDVEATTLFYEQSSKMLAFRESLSAKYPKLDFINYNDVKIGKTLFQLRLEERGVQCYEYGEDGRQPKQTPRPVIDLAECVPSFARFQQPEFERIRQHFLDTTITETKGAFKGLVATVEGLEYVFGTGGIHASVSSTTFDADDSWMIYDVDVTSLYPSIAIEHFHYPEHLGPGFVDIYRGIRAERMTHKKGTVENAALKLALNGVYGASNDKFSCFYDPLFTMKITIGGQMMLAMLVERLLKVADLRIIQANTDGITMLMPRSSKILVDAVCHQWEQMTRLQLEFVEYRKMVIADVNSYIAIDTKGNVKRKGRYEWDVEWHQDAGCLVAPKVAEKVLVEGAPIRETLRNWPDKMDFMFRAKANKGTTLQLAKDDRPVTLDRTQRYYVSTVGNPMFKIMPPLKGKTEDRVIAVQAGRLVTPCNNIREAINPIDFDFYAIEVEKLVQGVL